MNDRAGIEIVMGSRPGATMYVLGNGPSLDVPWMRHLNPVDCIGTNRILLHGYEPGYMLLVDYEVWREQRRGLLRSGCRLFLGADLWDQSDDIPLERSMCFQYPHDIEPDVTRPQLHHGWLTGYYAAAIAARMVYPGGSVVLAGMDLRYPDIGPDHSFGSGAPYGCHTKRFPEAIESFIKLRRNCLGDVRFFVRGDSALLEHFFSSFDLT